MLGRIRTGAQIMMTVVSFMGCYEAGVASESVLAAQYRSLAHRYDTRRHDHEAELSNST